ncbi:MULTISPECIES: putative RiPP precursor [unclassified Mesorhizobium]|nr:MULTISPECIES: putative RiPP precursor [unclassified Mesorhizobium]MDG4886754.1 putative RiPP precursor [Mesorhizobium sp. WSM4887]MDG4906927.1 putative RiPP precursor [Mesorhizobium sp. WSM4898]WIE93974.1 putative RiPP precursor [Mesorhizobium sp. WSM4875]
MKRTYEKPVLVKRDRLSAVTAVIVVSLVNGAASQ